jgi:hypothetical protein
LKYAGVYGISVPGVVRRHIFVGHVQLHAVEFVVVVLDVHALQAKADKSASMPEKKRVG